MCFPYCVEISAGEVAIVEKWGKYNRIMQPGLNTVAWPMERMVGRLSFRVQQLGLRIDSMTLGVYYTYKYGSFIVIASNSTVSQQRTSFRRLPFRRQCAHHVRRISEVSSLS